MQYMDVVIIQYHGNTMFLDMYHGNIGIFWSTLE